MDFGRLPIAPREPEVPILPAERWMKDEGKMAKLYVFRRPEDRDTFVQQLLTYEREVKHNAEIIIREGEVVVSITTHNVGVTELDMEYARFSDAVFRDLVYSPQHVR